ncbi:helix-turn-helix domain-containing protein [Dankookia sp. P2]|uniref:helix-turn-helix domain-containing protein n=1 Tax=Dankookia sp. P2 TaxID=3423955 RepID=UPI003D666252
MARGLALARALRRLASLSGGDPLATPAGLLQPLLPADAPPLRLRPEPLAAWRQAALDPGLPPLLASGLAAAGWMRAGAIEDAAGQPDPAQALLLAAAVLRRRGRLRAIPLPVWSGVWAAGGGRPAVLPLQDPRAWPAAFLGRVAAAAQRGLGKLARLRDAEATAAGLAAAGRRSLLPAAAEAALRMPAVTARGLARQLGITPQGALQLINRMVIAGVVREATGRRSFRAYVIG